MLDHEAHRADHLARIAEWARGLPPGAFISHQSAALVHGLPVYAIPAQVKVSGAKLRSTATSDLHVHRAGLRPQDVAVVDGIPVTSLARTTIDVARRTTFDRALMTADGALRAGCRRRDLEDVLRHQWTWPGVRHAMPVVRHANGRSESALESYVRSRVVLLRLPEPTVQFPVYGELGWIAQADLGWGRYRLVGEADGKVKYRDPDEVAKEKRRQEAIEEAGFAVIRWDWQQAHAPDVQFEARFWRKLRQGHLMWVLAKIA
jgi:very-short-patch-repair endonuclease